MGDWEFGAPPRIPNFPHSLAKDLLDFAISQLKPEGLQVVKEVDQCVDAAVKVG